jgi:hypothetical protein
MEATQMGREGIRMIDDRVMLGLTQEIWLVGNVGGSVERFAVVAEWRHEVKSDGPIRGGS